ncbi:hypothetical protein [Gordonia aichiensis]|uniref:Uncharacterized protein n=1 Tax=Gordonia aichiensis NBRC 108223 TaxID=1220583 RepID=L7KHH9_9ACTN|nr:hypothetical protein [Gordonia aichiensis]GAC48054.1 hypothetical protein GOACH_04_04520 [Gordonia aichiensis NBRC 108223]
MKRTAGAVGSLHARMHASSIRTIAIRGRYLTPDDAEWTNDGPTNWIIGRVERLGYSRFGAAGSMIGHLVLHNGGDDDLAVLSTPDVSGTGGALFTFLPSGASRILPDTGFHIVQGERHDGRPVLVGEIVDDGPLGPRFFFDGPTPRLQS